MRGLLAAFVRGLPLDTRSRRALDEALLDWAHETARANTFAGRCVVEARSVVSLGRALTSVVACDVSRASEPVARSTARAGWPAPNGFPIGRRQRVPAPAFRLVDAGLDRLSGDRLRCAVARLAADGALLRGREEGARSRAASARCRRSGLRASAGLSSCGLQRGLPRRALLRCPSGGCLSPRSAPRASAPLSWWSVTLCTTGLHGPAGSPSRARQASTCRVDVRFRGGARRCPKPNLRSLRLEAHDSLRTAFRSVSASRGRQRRGRHDAGGGPRRGHVDLGWAREADFSG